MYQDKWIVYIDYTDGGDLESWPPFYMEIYITDTEQQANNIGQNTLNAWKAKMKAEYGEVPNYGDYYVRKEGVPD